MQHSNLELVRSLGADRVIDYTKQRFTDEATAYDIVFDTVGKTSFAEVRPVLSRNGRYLVTEFGMRELLQMFTTRLVRGPRVIGGASNFHWTSDDLALIANMMLRTDSAVVWTALSAVRVPRRVYGRPSASAATWSTRVPYDAPSTK